MQGYLHQCIKFFTKMNNVLHRHLVGSFANV